MIRKKQPPKEIIIDLTGPDGNAFVLLAKARGFSKQLGLSHQEIEDEMMSGDYENLLQVFDKNFGHFVILER
jgi:hypothetical protein